MKLREASKKILDSKLSISKKLISVITLIMLGVITVVISIYYPPMQVLWENIWFILSLYIAILFINRSIFPARIICWPNIFISLLFLFHVGYYVPAKLNLVKIRPINISDSIIPLALTIFILSILSFEMGALVSCIRLRKTVKRSTISEAMKYRKFNLSVIGYGVITLGMLFFIVFLIQVKGISRLLSMNYSDFYTFINESDPRFSSLAISYTPIGLVLVYLGISEHRHGKRLGIKRASVVFLVIFVLWMLWVGNRGMALLTVLSFVYFYHVWIKPIKARNIFILFIVALLLISGVEQVRSLSTADKKLKLKDISINPFEAISEMGSTMRPYLGFITIFSSNSNRRFGIVPYVIALQKIVPNIGAETGSRIRGELFYRSNVWITETLDPYTARAGGGLGSSGIGEPYACFGHWGVIFVFISLGLIVAGLELKICILRSRLYLGIASFFFIPINWYVRDDIYGTLRPLIWGLIIMLVYSWTIRLRMSKKFVVR